MNATQVMSSPAIVLFADLPLREAGSILARHRISGAPVVDRDSRRLVGMLSEGDLLGAASTDRTGPALVGDVMTTAAITVDATTSVHDIAGRLLEAGVHRAPVMRGDEVVGVVSRHDLLKQMCRSDAAITVDVANLLREEGAALARLEVVVEEGLVELRGEAAPATVAFALELVRTVLGVTAARMRSDARRSPAWLPVETPALGARPKRPDGSGTPMRHTCGVAACDARS